MVARVLETSPSPAGRSGRGDGLAQKSAAMIRSAPLRHFEVWEAGQTGGLVGAEADGWQPRSVMRSSASPTSPLPCRRTLPECTATSTRAVDVWASAAIRVQPRTYAGRNSVRHTPRRAASNRRESERCDRLLHPRSDLRRARPHDFRTELGDANAATHATPATPSERRAQSGCETEPEPGRGPPRTRSALFDDQPSWHGAAPPSVPGSSGSLGRPGRKATVDRKCPRQRRLTEAVDVQTRETRQGISSFVSRRPRRMALRRGLGGKPVTCS